MGFFEAVRRWWTGEGLPRCFLCEGRVSRGDLARGRALVLGREPYCRACVKLFTGKPGKAGAALSHESSSSR